MNTPFKLLFSTAVFAASVGVLQEADAGGRKHGMRALSTRGHEVVRVRSAAIVKRQRVRTRASRSRGHMAGKVAHPLRKNRVYASHANRASTQKRRLKAPAPGRGRRVLIPTRTARISGRKNEVGHSRTLPNRVTVYGWNPQKKEQIVGEAEGGTVLDDRASRWMRTSQVNTDGAATSGAFVKKPAARNGYLQREPAPAGSSTGQQGNSVAMETLTIAHEGVDWSGARGHHPDFFWIPVSQANPPSNAVQRPRSKGFGFVTMDDRSDLDNAAPTGRGRSYSTGHFALEVDGAAH